MTFYASIADIVCLAQTGSQSKISQYRTICKGSIKWENKCLTLNNIYEYSKSVRLLNSRRPTGNIWIYNFTKIRGINNEVTANPPNHSNKYEGCIFDYKLFWGLYSFKCSHPSIYRISRTNNKYRINIYECAFLNCLIQANSPVSHHFHCLI